MTTRVHSAYPGGGEKNQYSNISPLLSAENKSKQNISYVYK